ncbi:37S ribosomal protein S24, mitochondrial [Podospora pseudopauciseta]|uniref:37S ribosomal protein S24, mitochondrial n=2 Tax=Podospora TaxID=5144 RepID=A0ABR0HCF1_9PEZI|nr:37S ribosomal protein S24, mitochondrial [Podospora pseudopauciseta]KAK4676715.1 37S ribosomal protein S24, mitochondrial [Podospora pseudoanserina]
MASAANSLRLCLRASRQLSVRPAASPLLRRALTTTAPQCARPGRKKGWKDPSDNFEFPEPYEGKVFQDLGEQLRYSLENDELAEADRAAVQQALASWENKPNEEKMEEQQIVKEIDKEFAPLRAPVRARRNSFWHEEEQDTDLITDEVGEDDFEENDMMAMGHAKLEEHREYREYARIAVWEMPLLSRFAKKFVPPKNNEVLRFRYTTYMGEFHPADRKVVVEFDPRDLFELTEVQRDKLRKLAGARYNPERGIIKMSCEKFELPAQNKRWLGDTIAKLITAAKDPTDTFEDIPLDTRHHKFKSIPKYPKEWYMSNQRRQQLLAQRRESLKLDHNKRQNSQLIDGVKVIQQGALSTLSASKEKEPVAVRVKPL